VTPTPSVTPSSTSSPLYSFNALEADAFSESFACAGTNNIIRYSDTGLLKINTTLYEDSGLTTPWVVSRNDRWQKVSTGLRDYAMRIGTGADAGKILEMTDCSTLPSPSPVTPTPSSSTGSGGITTNIYNESSDTSLVLTSVSVGGTTIWSGSLGDGEEVLGLTAPQSSSTTIVVSFGVSLPSNNTSVGVELNRFFEACANYSGSGNTITLNDVNTQGTQLDITYSDLMCQV